MQPKTLAIGIVVIAGFAGFWELMVWLLQITPFLLPPPSAIGREFVQRAGLYLDQSWATLWAAVLGFVLASIAGIVLGTMIFGMEGQVALDDVYTNAFVRAGQLPKV